MVAGDIVNWISNTATTYQPAVGVEIIILVPFLNANAAECGIYNGVNKATAYYAANDDLTIISKIGITNTNYYLMTTLTQGGFSGIQIK
tara:strand:+ start:682 stop:948 length:267 start_codon:yes stop_codon:yes gene_type:complete